MVGAKPNLAPLLSADEARSLKGLSLGCRLMPEGHKAKLISLGYVKDTPDGLVPTDMGELRVEIGNLV